MFYVLHIEHIEHIRDVSGVDHIGIGADYDGKSYRVLVLCIENSERFKYTLFVFA